MLSMGGLMTASFDFKSFAKDLTKQAETSIPEDIALEHKKEFLERIYNFTYIAGEAFSNDESIGNSETAKILTQIISEWTFHKYIDLLRSDIPDMYHESILQKLAYVAFEMGKEAELGCLTQDQMLVLVELQVKKAFEKACSSLYKSGKISSDAYQKALNLSNIDEYSNNLNSNFRIESNRKNTFKYTLSALGLGLITLLANILYPESLNLILLNTVVIIILSMYAGFYIGVNRSLK